MHRLGDLVEIFDGPHATPTKEREGPIFLGVASLVGGRLDLSDVARLSEQDFAKWTRRVTPRHGDVVFSYETRLGEAALVPFGLECCLGRRMGLLRVRSKQVHPRYLLYAYLGPQFQHVIRERTIHGSTVDRIPLRTMGRFPIMLPAPDEQQQILSVLGALDDKIDSNRRLATLLEQTAAELFRARFVDFVGVEEFEDSEIGRIPRGWRVGRLTDFVEQLRERGPTNAPYIGLDDMPRGSTVLTEWKHEGAPTGQSVRFQRGDILFGKLRPYFKKVGVASLDGRCSAEIVVLRPCVPESFGFSIGHLTSARFFEHCDAVSTGTRMPRAEWKLAGELAVGYPAGTELAEFNALVATTYDAILGLTHESHTLAAIRDALLPELISGVIRVPATVDLAEVIEPVREQLAATSR